MSDSKPFDAQVFKDNSRVSRLSNKVERKLREEWRHIALKKCHEETQAFVNCSKEHGFLVVINCRKQLAALNECCTRNSAEEEFEKYKVMRLRELDNMS